MGLSPFFFLPFGDSASSLTLPFFCSLFFSLRLMCLSMLVSPRVMRAECQSMRAPNAKATELREQFKKQGCQTLLRGRLVKIMSGGASCKLGYLAAFWKFLEVDFSPPSTFHQRTRSVTCRGPRRTLCSCGKLAGGRKRWVVVSESKSASKSRCCHN